MGVLQPILVRPKDDGEYELIAGERRWRAAQLAELHEIPAVIRDVTDQQAMAMGLIENIQRQDLNPVEEAIALKRLIEEFSLTQQEAADAVGRSRVAVANLLRLLTLEFEQGNHRLYFRCNLHSSKQRYLCQNPCGNLLLLYSPLSFASYNLPKRAYVQLPPFL